MKRLLNKKSILILALLIISILSKNVYYIGSSILLLLFNGLVYKRMASYKDKKAIKYFNKLSRLYMLFCLILIVISMSFIYNKDGLINTLLIGISMGIIAIPNNARFKNINSLIKYQEYNYVIRSSVIISNLLVSILYLPSIISPNILLFFEILIMLSGLTFKTIEKEKDSSVFENEIVTIIQSLMISSSEILIYAYILGASENIILGNTVIMTIFVLCNFFLVTVKLRKYNNIKNLIFMTKNNVYLFPISLIYLILIYIPIGNKLFNTSKLTIYSLLLCFLLAYVFVCWYDFVKLMRRKK